jgi:hypothetical protein
MLRVSTKGILVCYTFVSVQFNGILKFPWTVKIREFESFSKFKSRGGRYRVKYGSTLKSPGRRLSYGVCITLRDTRQSVGNDGQVEYKFS